MRYDGQLTFVRESTDYGVFSEGNFYELTKTLNTMLLEQVKIDVFDNKGNTLFSNEGKLVKQKKGKGFYLYHVGKKNLDEVLWNNVGNKITIELNNISKI